MEKEQLFSSSLNLGQTRNKVLYFCESWTPSETLAGVNVRSSLLTLVVTTALADRNLELVPLCVWMRAGSTTSLTLPLKVKHSILISLYCHALCSHGFCNREKNSIYLTRIGRSAPYQSQRALLSSCFKRLGVAT